KIKSVFMGYLKVINKGKGPMRLFIGGVHGKEGITTIKALSQIHEIDVPNGKLLIDQCFYVFAVIMY
ncbi:MAG: DUF2119 domain-containing protein, partial [Methanobacterium paludis]|nr:DUF2119 domain-containing protein [Methanobacterium paludis]